MKMSYSNEIMKNDDLTNCQFYLDFKRDENNDKLSIEWNQALKEFLEVDFKERMAFKISFEYLQEDFIEYENSILSKYCDFKSYFQLKKDIDSFLIRKATNEVCRVNFDLMSQSEVKEFRHYLTMIINKSYHEYDFEFLYLEFKDRWNKWREDKSKYKNFNEFLWSYPKNDWIDITEVLESDYPIQGIMRIKEEEYLDRMYGPNSDQYNDTKLT